MTWSVDICQLRWTRAALHFSLAQTPSTSLENSNHLLNVNSTLLLADQLNANCHGPWLHLTKSRLYTLYPELY
ncbi:unnamed protein product [Cuscuta campestris]|uniref:Uncharacterized protein n=1 Tax=Cuscuta campestris TaxID=132261 RepID=A0A484KNX5_9ASTE|nr:unnamed protein product [Cuscuta campestris]